jgi:phosphatidylglycerol lysyltransferase
MGQTTWQTVRPLVVLAAAAFGLAALHHALANVRYETLWRDILALSWRQVVLAAGCTILGYGALTLYDALALRYIRHAVSYRRLGLVSFIGHALSNSIGHALIPGASVRARLYSAWGIPARKLTRMAAFGGLTLWLGPAALIGTALVLEPSSSGPLAPLPAILLGLGLLGGLMLYLVWCARRRPPVIALGVRFVAPPLPIALRQLAASALDWLFAAAALYVLLPGDVGLPFLGFASLFIAAQAIGLASQVPGGLLVFEGTLLLLLPHGSFTSAVAGALLVFRLIYYLVPLALAGTLLAVSDLERNSPALGRASRTLGRVVPAITPPALAATVFVTGSILLFSGATPTVGWRLTMLRDLLPLPVLEASHFLSSLVGAGLLLLAHGLYRRLNAAWGLTVGLLLTAVVVSLLKGLDFEEAVVAATVLAALLPAERFFYRRASLLDERFSGGWVAAVGLVFAASIWLGFFAYRHVEFSNDLWWQFEFGADAPRFLRATVGAMSLALLVGLLRLLRPARPTPTAPLPDDLDQAAAVLAHSDRASSNLALLGDKTLLFNRERTAFLMYQIEGRSWIAMGDPIGPPSDAAELAWQLRELSDRHGGWPVFYEVGREQIPLYIDLGLSLTKLGEEARVPLQGFTLEGQARASLRRWRNACERAGCQVELLPPGGAIPLIPELERISREWLASKHTREKRFSLGAFSEPYLGRFPLAVVRQHGRPVAFASLWTTATRAEVAVDLMRYAADAPPNVMTYLFVSLMQWAKEEGYGWFNLGMAPLAGLPQRALAPLWARAAGFVYGHGEHLYNFCGLREYKNRFDPVWEPRYIASPGGLTLPFVFTNVATAVSGGLAGVFSK